MIREVLGYSVFREMDVPSSRTGYSFVKLNGAAYGVYLNIETMDDVSLPRWYESTQHLYEGTYGPSNTRPKCGCTIFMRPFWPPVTARHSIVACSTMNANAMVIIAR